MFIKKISTWKHRGYVKYRTNFLGNPLRRSHNTLGCCLAVFEGLEIALVEIFHQTRRNFLVQITSKVIQKDNVFENRTELKFSTYFCTAPKITTLINCEAEVCVLVCPIDYLFRIFVLSYIAWQCQLFYVSLFITSSVSK